MKYTRLTKEQLEAMHEDFARFLATQQITADEWQKIKQVMSAKTVVLTLGNGQGSARTVVSGMHL